MYNKYLFQYSNPLSGSITQLLNFHFNDIETGPVPYTFFLFCFTILNILRTLQWSDPVSLV